MKITVVGAGAIGGFLGARLSAAGEEVTFIARNNNLQAINANGFRLIEENGSELHAKGVRAVQRYLDAGPQDVVLLTVKAHQVRDLLPDLRGLFGPETMVVSMINGVPWWYFHQLAGPWEGRSIEAVDPGGLIAAHIEPERVIGSVVYPAAELHGLAAGAFHEVVLGGGDHEISGARVMDCGNIDAVRADDVRGVRGFTRRQNLDEGRLGVGLPPRRVNMLNRRPRRRRHRNRRRDAAAHGREVGVELDNRRRARVQRELFFHLREVAVFHQPVGFRALGPLAKEKRFFDFFTGPADAAERVHHNMLTRDDRRFE